MKKNRFWIITIIIIIIGGAVGYYFFKHRTKTTVALPPVITVPVKLAIVQYKMLPWQVSGLGQMIAPQTIMLTAKQPGELVGLFFKSGQWVKKGQILAKIDDLAELADLRNAQAEFIAKKINYDRYAHATKGAVMESLVTTARGDMLAAKALVAAKKKSLADTNIVAPFSGRMGAIQSVSHTFGNKTIVTQVAKGAYLIIGSPIATLTNPENMVVEYQLPQQYSSDIRSGQPVSVVSSAYPKQIFQGAVNFVSSLVDDTNQTYTIRALIQNNKHQLRSGMQVFITQTLNPNRKVLAVPGLSLVPTIAGYSVYTVEKNKIQAVPVAIGERHDTWVEVKSGLKAGDSFVVAGMQNVHLGSLVKVEK